MKVHRLISVLLCLSLWAAPSSLDQDKKLDEILDRIGNKYDTTQALFCRFEQWETISQLKQQIHLEGKLYFRKPHFIMMEMRGDENLDLYVNGEHIWLEDLDLDEVEVFDFQERNSNRLLMRFLPPFFLRSFEELRELFDIALISTEDGDSRLELIPLDPGNSTFESLQFDVDDLGRISWLKMVYDAENVKEMRFRGWKKTPEISKYFFQYRKKYP